jgi:transposase
MDLHSNTTQVGIMDEARKRVIDRKLRNDPELILKFLEPYRADLEGIVVESTYNWYWLVDALQERGYRVHLAHPVANQQYRGLKHSDDRHDAFWLAELLNLGILRSGYIYPRELRSVRDLLRKRLQLVRYRTALLLSVKNMIHRNRGLMVEASQIKRLTQDVVSPLLQGDEALGLAGRVSKEAMDCLSRQIQQIERWVLKQVRLEQSFSNLLTLPGVGEILAMSLLLETGPIERFSKVSQYASYCRLVSSQWTSNDKLKGRGNVRNGNRYLAWAYSEASDHARRYDPLCRTFYNRKLNQRGHRVAHKALAHKLARAAYFILRDHEVYREEKMFS